MHTEFGLRLSFAGCWMDFSSCRYLHVVFPLPFSFPPFFILYLLNFPFSLFSPSLLLSLSRSLASLASPLGKIKANIEELSEIHTRHSETADALRAQGLIEAKLMQLGYQISTFNFRTVRFLPSSRLLSSSFCSSSSSVSFLFQIKVRTLLLEGWIANPIWRNY